MTTFERTLDHVEVRTISFDGDGTLWDFRSVMRKALELTLQQLRLMVANDEAKRLTVQNMIEIRDCVASELGEGVVTHEEIRYAAFVKTLEYIGSPSKAVADQLYQLYMDARFTGLEPYPDVPAALTDLKSRYQIGMISNGNSYPARSGLPNTFHFAVFAHECGFAKPDPRIFEIALVKSGSQPEHVLHVGDSLENDVFGANNCGLHSVWLNRNHRTNETDIAPDLEVSDFSELLSFL